MASLFNILVNIEANSARLEATLKQAADKIDDFAASVEKTARRAAEFAGLSLGVDALAQSIKRAADNGDRLQLLSERMGTSVESLSRLQYAAKISEVPLDTLTGALDHLHQILGRAELGSGRAGKALAAMGIDAKKLLDLPFDKQLGTLAEKFGAITNPAQRAARELIVFGGAGAQLDPLFRQGVSGINALLSEADRLGLTLDGNMTPKLKQAHDAIVNAESAWQKAATTLATSLAPAVEKIANFFAKATSGVKDFAEGLARYFHGADTPVAALSDQLEKLTQQSLRINSEITALENKSTGFLGYPGQFDSQIASRKKQLADISAQIGVVTAQLEQARREEGQAKPGKVDVSGGADIAPLPDLTVLVTNQKILTDRMKELLDSFTRDTETDTEKVAAAWYKLEAELKDLRDTGIIDQEEYAKRFAASLDSILPTLSKAQIGALGAKIVQPAKDQFTELQRLGERAAQSLQEAFAQYLFDPFHTNLRKLGLDFVTILQKMAAEAAASSIFKALFGDQSSNAKGASGSGLGGIIGSGLDKFFAGGATGGGGGGQSTAGKVLGGASGLLGKLFGQFFGGGGGGSTGISSSDWQGAYSDLANMSTAIPGLAEGGLVSAGSSYLVGEEGPELFTASSHGIITPNDKLGGSDTHIHMGDTHIDARGADADRVLTLVQPMIELSGQRKVAQILNAFRRTGLPTPTRV